MSHAPSPQGTENALLRARLAAAQRVTPEERLLAGLEHSDLAMQVVADGIRHQFPQANEATLRQLLCERIALMRRLEERERDR